MKATCSVCKKEKDCLMPDSVRRFGSFEQADRAVILKEIAARCQAYEPKSYETLRTEEVDQ